MIKKISFSLATLIFLFGAFFFASSAEALTTDELRAALAKSRAEFQAILAQIENYNSGRTGNYITKDLKSGDSDSQVKKLQVFLNADPDTLVASSGVRSSGQEDTKFEGMTKAAVTKFQEKYAADILTPLGLTAGSGRVSAKTREQINRLAPTLLKLDSDLAGKAISSYSSLSDLATALNGSADLKYWSKPVAALGLLGATPAELSSDYASTSDLIRDLAETGQAADLAELFASIKNLGGSFSDIKRDFGGLSGFLSTIKENLGAKRLPYLADLFINLKAVGGTWADVTVDSGFTSLKGLIEDLSRKDDLEATVALLKEIANLNKQLDDLLKQNGNLSDLEREVCRNNTSGYYNNSRYGNYRNTSRYGGYCDADDYRNAISRGNQLSPFGNQQVSPQSQQQRQTNGPATNSPAPAKYNDPTGAASSTAKVAPPSETGAGVGLFYKTTVKERFKCKVEAETTIKIKGVGKDEEKTVPAKEYEVFTFGKLDKISYSGVIGGFLAAIKNQVSSLLAALGVVAPPLSSAGGISASTDIPDTVKAGVFVDTLSSKGRPLYTDSTNKTREGYGYVGPKGMTFQRENSSPEMNEAAIKKSLASSGDYDGSKGLDSLKEKIAVGYETISKGDEIKISFLNTKQSLRCKAVEGSQKDQEVIAYVIDKVAMINDKKSYTPEQPTPETPVQPAVGGQTYSVPEDLKAVSDKYGLDVKVSPAGALYSDNEAKVTAYLVNNGSMDFTSNIYKAGGYDYKRQAGVTATGYRFMIFKSNK